MAQRSFLNGIVAAGCFAVSLITVSVLADDRTTAASAQTEIQMMDTNQDGRISAAEHAAGARDMFAKMDADQDHKVTAAEMDAAHKSMPTAGHDPKSTMSSAAKIKVIDTNGDGILSAQEHEAGSQSMFARMDTDHDGALTAREIDAGHAALMTKEKKESY